mmetsp:Transcript_35914/g.79959  ORF Transcript_35914/g.79959 Transcript_35914/m.79959 type:complete len:235 (+) Transcript_35914:400-1104(+)
MLLAQQECAAASGSCRSGTMLLSAAGLWSGHTRWSAATWAASAVQMAYCCHDGMCCLELPAAHSLGQLSPRDILHAACCYYKLRGSCYSLTGPCGAKLWGACPVMAASAVSYINSWHMARSHASSRDSLACCTASAASSWGMPGMVASIRANMDAKSGLTPDPLLADTSKKLKPWLVAHSLPSFSSTLRVGMSHLVAATNTTMFSAPYSLLSCSQLSRASKLALLVQSYTRMQP